MNARTLIATAMLTLLAAGQAAAQDAPTTDASSAQRYSILLRPEALAIPAGASGQATLLVGGAGNASIQIVAQPPAGIAVSFAQDTVQLPARPAYVNFTIKIDSSVAPGYYKVPIATTSDAGTRHDATLTIKVPEAARTSAPPASTHPTAAPARFTMGFDPREAKAAPNSTLSVTLLVGGAGNDTIDLAVRENAFGATLATSTVQMPQKPAKIAVTLVVPADAAPGDHRIIVDAIARESGERHDAGLVLHVIAEHATRANETAAPATPAHGAWLPVPASEATTLPSLPPSAPHETHAARPVNQTAAPQTIEIDLDSLLGALGSGGSGANDIVLNLANGGAPLRIVLHVSGERHAEKLDVRFARDG